jgi:ABC-type transport system involved in multi-copper enzyme maturation permease subunit
MTTSAAVWIGVRKEARALLPMWAACAGILAAIGVSGDRGFAEAGRLVFFMGSVGLAAWSIGHEYTHRTVPLMLSLPAARQRLLLVKLGVATVLLLALTAVVLVTLPSGPGFDRAELMPLLSTLCAVMLAPLLTMACRSPLAGAVFGMGLTAWVHVIPQIIGLVMYGSAREPLVIDLRWWGLLGVSLLAGAAGWIAFMQLEAIDGLPDVHWPHGWRRAAAPAAMARRQHPLWLLVKKELRLQQMTFIVTAFFVVTGLVLWMLSTVVDGLRGGPIAPIVAIYGVMLAWLTGSLASAEERHLGTHESQLLLPVAAWQQWVVKVAVAMGLALLFGFVLPIAVSGTVLRFNVTHAGLIVVLTTVSLFCSSLCRSGLQSLTVSAPVALVMLRFAGPYFGQAFPGGTSTPLMAVAGGVGLALALAFRNHRFSARR